MAENAPSKLKQFQDALLAFFHERDLDKHEEARASKLRKFAHFWLLVGKSFHRNRCLIRATALAYTTLLALIPMLAIAISITTTLLKQEGEKPVRDLVEWLVGSVAPSLNLRADGATTEKRAEVVTKITDFVANIQSGKLGVTSMIVLVFVAIGLLRTIEATFNDIWGVTRGRGLVSSFVHYWTAISVGPLILVLAIGLTTGPHFRSSARLMESVPWLGAALLWLLPFVVLTFGFAILYQLMPNTRVQWRAALVGGLVGGCLWQLNNLFNVIYVSNVVTYSKIYGSLAVIPLFLVGLYLSWLILLFGAQVAYAYQNRRSYLQEKQAETVNQRGREFVALRLMTHIGRAFQSGARAPSAIQLGNTLGVPTRLVSQIARALLQSQLLVEVSHAREAGYAPARPLEQITASDVLTCLRSGQGREPATREDEWREPVRKTFENIGAAEAAAGTVTLAELARRPAS